MHSSPPRRSLSSLLAGAAGGLLVLAIGAVLIATGVIDTSGDTREVARDSSGDAPPIETSDAAEGRRTVNAIYREEGRGVVSVEAEGVSSSSDSPFGLPDQGGTASGSGFVVDEDGTILTNAHVVEGADQVRVRFGEDGDAVDAEVVGEDADSDLAVLKVDPEGLDLVALPLGDSSAAQVGDPVIAIGNPFGVGRTVTTGIVSAVDRQIKAPSGFQIDNALQTDASINPGNSGGPLLDAQGRVIGINSQIATGGGGGGSVGVGFAVPIDTVKKLLPELRRGEEIERAYFGIEMADVTEDTAAKLDLPVEDGALIQSVEPGTAAADAGLRGGRPTADADGVLAGGDLLTEVDGERIEAPADVAAAIADDGPGDEVEVTYYRGEDERSTTVTLGERPASIDAAQQGRPQLP
jgi:S1-C subfamily serine protease